MKLLFIGDIVGKKGREAIRDFLPSIKEKYNIDFTIANGENSAHGKGITKKIYNELLSYGIDCITMGNHTYSKKEILEDISDLDKLIVPENIITKQGNGYRIFKIDGIKICVANFLGEAFMGDYMSSPYNAMSKVLKEIKDKHDILVVDFHGESTAEKRIFLEYFINDIDVLIGTHTHIQTADEDIIKGSAFISDVGMCGPYDSIIGRDIKESIDQTVNKIKTHYTISENKAIFCAAVIEFDKNKVYSIERIQIRP